jgi:hypothetical protein
MRAYDTTDPRDFPVFFALRHVVFIAISHQKVRDATIENGSE